MQHFLYVSASQNFCAGRIIKFFLLLLSLFSSFIVAVVGPLLVCGQAFMLLSMCVCVCVAVCVSAFYDPIWPPQSGVRVCLSVSNFPPFHWVSDAADLFHNAHISSSITVLFKFHSRLVFNFKCFWEIFYIKLLIAK